MAEFAVIPALFGLILVRLQFARRPEVWHIALAVARPLIAGDAGGEGDADERRCGVSPAFFRRTAERQPTKRHARQFEDFQRSARS
jgi:hypothetical protein